MEFSWWRLRNIAKAAQPCWAFQMRLRRPNGAIRGFACCFDSQRVAPIWSPNLIWNAQHGWAAFAMLRSLHQENSTLGASLGFIPSQFFVVGPVLIVLWLGGLRHLLRQPFARPLGVTYLILLVVFTVTGAKSYYLAGMYFILFAAGGSWAEERLDARRPPRGIRGWVALMTVGLVIALPLALPVLPATALAKGPWEGSINKDLSATVGWQSLVAQIAEVSASLPAEQRAHLVILTGDYGAAGAVDLYGRSYGLPNAISGDNSYWWWGPATRATGQPPSPSTCRNRIYRASSPRSPRRAP